MTGMTYADLMLRQIGKKGASGFGLRASGDESSATRSPQLVADYLGIPESNYALQALKWLGLFNDVPMNRKIDSTFEVTSDLMIGKMSLGLAEQDMVVLQHTFLAGFSDGRKEVLRSRMLDFGSLSTDTSIARTVALPAAIGVEMILTGKINAKGVHIPVIPEIYNPVLDQLENMNIKNG